MTHGNASKTWFWTTFQDMSAALVALFGRPSTVTCAQGWACLGVQVDDTKTRSSNGSM